MFCGRPSGPKIFLSLLAYQGNIKQTVFFTQGLEFDLGKKDRTFIPFSLKLVT